MYVRPRPAGSSTEHVFTYRERRRRRRHNRDRGYACFQEKYYLGYVLLEQLSIATDIQFHVFNFQICLPWLFTKKELYSAHTGLLTSRESIRSQLTLHVGKRRSRWAADTELKTDKPEKHVKEYPNEPLTISNGKLFCRGIRA